MEIRGFIFLKRVKEVELVENVHIFDGCFHFIFPCVSKYIRLMGVFLLLLLMVIANGRLLIRDYVWATARASDGRAQPQSNRNHSSLVKNIQTALQTKLFRHKTIAYAENR